MATNEEGPLTTAKAKISRGGRGERGRERERGRGDTGRKTDERRVRDRSERESSE